MPKIRVLDKHTAELISAGEVVERPASVVKELTENAIDAGASLVEVEIADGGVRYIEIRDDGCGIAPEDMPNAFVRHATSKIEDETDLDAIQTLGFRGEALASVAGVARVSLVSKTAEDETAWRYEIAGGEELSLAEDARAQGTTITVRDLFYNTPARMKFLKKDVSEGTYVQEVLQQLALSHPEVSFRFIREGKQQFFTSGDGKLVSTVCALFPRDYARELVPVQDVEGMIKVTGLVTPPRAARASRAMQFFFVNGRCIKNRALAAAVENAFRGMLMGGRFPGCVLYVNLPASEVDVNVHPAKTEVRFARESDVFSAVYRAVKAALLHTANSLQKTLQLSDRQPIPSSSPVQGVQISFSAQPVPSQQMLNGTAMPVSEVWTPEDAQKQTTLMPPEKSDKSNPEKAGQDGLLSGLYPALQPDTEPVILVSDAVDPFHKSVPENLSTEKLRHGEPQSKPSGTAFPRRVSASLDIDVEQESMAPAAVANQSEYEPEKTGSEQFACQTESADESQRPNPQPKLIDSFLPQEEQWQLVGELFRTYILATRGDELCIIDKHAAHERLIYEELARSYGSVAGQLLLMPVTVELSATEKNALLEQQEYLDNIGIAVEDFGGCTVVVREVPADIRVDSVEAMIQEIAARFATGQREPLSEKTSWVLHSIACRAAIKGGENSRAPELLKLAQGILDGSVPPFCPHGRPVVLRITRKELEKQFGRLG